MPRSTERRGSRNEISRRRPIFPGGCPPSIFGAGELNFRVRDGNGWNLSASVTGIDLQFTTHRSGNERVEGWKRRSSSEAVFTAPTRSSDVLVA
jgi:hypothetical protein